MRMFVYTATAKCRGNKSRKNWEKKHKQNMIRKNILPTNSADVFVLHIILYFYLQFMHMEKKEQS